MVLLLSYLLSALACMALYPALGSVSAKHIDRKHIQALQRQAADRFNKNRLTLPPGQGGFDIKLNPGVKNFTFSNPAASGESISGEDCWEPT